MRSISRSTSWAASPAPATITSLPRATIERLCGRSMIVRASIREPATNASVSRPSITQTVRGTAAAWTSKKREDEEHDERRGDDPARRAPHVARRDVAPPAVVEAEEREDRELDRRDEAEHLPADVALVVDRQLGVEAEPEGEEPGGDDDREVCRQLRQPMPVERGSSRLGRDAGGVEHRLDDALLLPPRRSRPRAAARGSRAAACSVSGSEPRLLAQVAQRGLEMERRHVVRGRGDLALGERGRDPVAIGRADDVHVVDVAGARRPAARQRRRGRARRSAPRPRAATRSSRRGAGARSRRNAACIASSREFVPISSNVCLSREPWKRSIRSRSASRVVGAGDEAAVAEREQVLGREEAEGRADAGGRDPLGAERLRGVLDHRQTEARRARRAARAARTGGRA